MSDEPELVSSTPPPSLDCAFCLIAHGMTATKLVGQGRHHVIFEPLNPHAPGHVLFVARHHIKDVTHGPIFGAAILAAASKYVRDVLQGPANIITSVGAEATQSIFHLHIHVIPRGPRDGLASRWPWVGQPLRAEDSD